MLFGAQLKFLGEIQEKELELNAAQTEFTGVLGRLAERPVNEATRAMVQRYTAGELTARQLDEAISRYLRLGQQGRQG